MNHIMKSDIENFIIYFTSDENERQEMMNVLNEYEKQEERTFAQTNWCAEDIKTLRPEWSTEQCEEFLEKHSGHIVDNMVADGWLTIECALRDDGL